MEADHRCQVCNKGKAEGVTILRCAGCRNAYYCGYAHQRADWPAHKTQCRKPAAAATPAPAVVEPPKRPYDIGHIGTSHDEKREINMLVKDDVRDRAGGWWMLPSLTVPDGGEEMKAWAQKTFDKPDYNREHVSWKEIFECPHCGETCLQGHLGVQIMHRKKDHSSLVYIRPFPRLFHATCLESIFATEGKTYPSAQCVAATTLEEAWKTAQPDTDELQGTLAKHDPAFQSEVKPPPGIKPSGSGDGGDSASGSSSSSSTPESGPSTSS